MSLIVIEYKTNVHTPSGWRATTVKAEAKQISPKMAEVVRVVAVAGEAPAYQNSVTGAKRQGFCGLAIAQREKKCEKTPVSLHRHPMR